MHHGDSVDTVAAPTQDWLAPEQFIENIHTVNTYSSEEYGTIEGLHAASDHEHCRPKQCKGPSDWEENKSVFVERASLGPQLTSMDFEIWLHEFHLFQFDNFPQHLQKMSVIRNMKQTKSCQ
jgi:hypothetical protein